MGTLFATTPHYVRCVKPNDLKQPFTWVFSTSASQFLVCIMLLRVCMAWLLHWFILCSTGHQTVNVLPTCGRFWQQLPHWHGHDSIVVRIMHWFSLYIYIIYTIYDHQQSLLLLFSHSYSLPLLSYVHILFVAFAVCGPLSNHCLGLLCGWLSFLADIIAECHSITQYQRWAHLTDRPGVHKDFIDIVLLAEILSCIPQRLGFISVLSC